ncbi:nucleotidyltransferase domain-containing protein [Barrientosiimonas endolithica]|uniref:Polymerase nucleotidyl transferase domain-containing protein n=1 Tax=Barrientosiimonas endolithica TaxID=1535208 RepID=A0ABN6YN63_9MICO|nr:nucleotidyltransferase domain-containing protein [Barrientosiimonas endolithica]BDZ58867.1 hypothetical protein GCM10025872_25240 [Barrientosiimonas endolithica]
MTLPQEEFIARASEVLGADDRVRGLWLTGSLGDGTADEFSDVDSLVVVEDSSYDDVLAEWDDLAREVAPFVLVKQLFPGAPIFNHITPEWLRWDVVLVRPQDAAERFELGAVRELFDRDGMTVPDPEPAGPADQRAARGIVEEFIRVQGLLPVVLGRGELVTAASGAGLTRQHLTSLLRLRAEGSRPSGALHLSRVLPAELIAELAALPPVSADRDSVVALHRRTWELFMPVARELLGQDFPDALATACANRLSSCLAEPWPA